MAAAVQHAADEGLDPADYDLPWSSPAPGPAGAAVPGTAPGAVGGPGVRAGAGRWSGGSAAAAPRRPRARKARGAPRRDAVAGAGAGGAPVGDLRGPGRAPDHGLSALRLGRRPGPCRSARGARGLAPAREQARRRRDARRGARGQPHRRRRRAPTAPAPGVCASADVFGRAPRRGLRAAAPSRGDASGPSAGGGRRAQAGPGRLRHLLTRHTRVAPIPLRRGPPRRARNGGDAGGAASHRGAGARNAASRRRRHGRDPPAPPFLEGQTSTARVTLRRRPRRSRSPSASGASSSPWRGGAGSLASSRTRPSSSTFPASGSRSVRTVRRFSS
jgi:hypothetical protein